MKTQQKQIKPATCNFEQRLRVKSENMSKEDDIFTVPEGWKEPKFTPEDNQHGMLDTSHFEILFPKYREEYFQKSWSMIQDTLAEYKIKCQLDVIKGEIKVVTTRKTWDPYSIIRARQLIQCIARSVPFEQAVRVMDDDVACDIINIKRLVLNKRRFVKRRQRLIGPNSSSLKAIELLSGCYMMVHGGTVSLLGRYKGLKEARSIIESCMSKNIHPVRSIKDYLVKRECEKNPALKN